MNLAEIISAAERGQISHKSAALATLEAVRWVLYYTPDHTLQSELNVVKQHIEGEGNIERHRAAVAVGGIAATAALPNLEHPIIWRAVDTAARYALTGRMQLRDDVDVATVLMDALRASVERAASHHPLNADEVLANAEARFNEITYAA